MAQLAPDPSGRPIQNSQGLLSFTFGAAQHGYKYFGMTKIGAQLYAGYCDESDPAIFHVAGKQQTYFLLDLKREPLGSS
jgi:hypothetical protein